MISASILVFVILFWALARWQSSQLADLSRYEKCADAFYDATNKLIQDSDVPDEILLTLEYLNRQINEPKAARLMMLFPLIKSGAPSAMVMAS